MEFTMINGNSMATQAYEVLKRQIVSGDYHPGDKISEQVVADRLGVSRSPVREAIHRLANEGLVDFYPRRGAFMKIYTEKDIQDSFELRLMLERYAISRIRPELVEQKRDELLDLRTAFHTPTRRDYVELDGRFHDTVTSLCGNESLLKLYRLLYTQISAFRMIVLLDDDAFLRANACHIQMVDAILHGDIGEVRHLITEHIEDSEQSVKRYYEEYEE